MPVALIAALIPALPHIIVGIEAMFKGAAKVGTTKKQIAINLLSDLVNGFGAYSQQGGANSALMAFIDKEVDNVVEYMNASGQFQHA